MKRELQKRSTEELLRIIEQQDQYILHLQSKVDFLSRKRFTPTSEKFANQPSLFATQQTTHDIPTENDPQTEELKPLKKRKKGGRRSPPDSLPHIRVEHDLSEEEKICSCGCGMRRIKEIKSQQYDVVPASFRVIDHIRFVYVCKSNCGAKPRTSPLTPQPLPKTQASPSFLATIAVQKFEDALPLHRQASIYKKRFGVEFTTTTLSEWMIKTSKLCLEPLVDKLSEIQKSSGYIHADETTLQVLKEKNKKAQSRSYLWLQVSSKRHPIVLMHYSATRSSKTAEKIFEGFRGYLQTDGYPGYNGVASKESVTQLGCWAHARRRFADILKYKYDQNSKELSTKAINLIAKLYKIEKEIKDKPPDEKYTIRQKKSVPVVKEIEKWIQTDEIASLFSGGKIYEAFRYLKNQLPNLSVYLTNGELDIDNNLAENHVRPIALGRKNWLFATSTRGAHALANWYSIIETAKANDIVPFDYLEYLLTQMPIYQAQKKRYRRTASLECQAYFRRYEILTLAGGGLLGAYYKRVLDQFYQSSL